MNAYTEARDEILPRTHCPANCDGNGTYAVMGEDGEPEPAQCQWCYEVVMPLRDAIDDLIRKHVIGEDEEPRYGIARVGDAVQLIGDVYAANRAIRAEQRKIVGGE